MALPQDINPLNSALMDTVSSTSKMDWIEYEPGGALKVLWTGPETGRWICLFKWDKGFVARAHKHLSGAFAFVIKGKLQVRDGIFDEGDFVYEPNGMLRRRDDSIGRHGIPLPVRRTGAVLRRRRLHRLPRLGRARAHEGTVRGAEKSRCLIVCPMAA